LKTHLRSAMHRALIASVVEARESAGLTQRALAAKLKRSDSFVWKFEAGERQLKVLEFIEIAAALDVEPEELLRRVRKSAAR
jgi:transcriptional regulator with XRE-family HTH domain